MTGSEKVGGAGGGRWLHLDFSVFESVRDVFTAAVVLHTEQRITLPAVHQRDTAGRCRQLQRHVHAPLANDLRDGGGVRRSIECT
jgi:hypothetical protein